METRMSNPSSSASKVFFRSLTAFAAMALIGHGAVSFGQTSASSSDKNGDKTDDQKLDVSGLEKKYWAAKDTDFSVVQNRLFSKAKRFALSVEGGTAVNDSWSNDPTLGVDLNYYFTERYGVQLEYMKTNASDNKATSSLESNQGGEPNHNKINDFYGVGFNWVPFYAKISVLNSSIIYFDMSITPSIGLTDYTQQIDTGGVKKSSPTVCLDITQHYFINKWFAIRFDFKNHWYQEDIVAYHGGQKVPGDTNYESLIMGGLTFYF